MDEHDIYARTGICRWRNMHGRVYTWIGIYAWIHIRGSEYTVERLFNAERSRLVADHGRNGRQGTGQYRAVARI